MDHFGRHHNPIWVEGYDNVLVYRFKMIVLEIFYHYEIDSNISI